MASDGNPHSAAVALGLAAGIVAGALALLVPMQAPATSHVVLRPVHPANVVMTTAPRAGPLSVTVRHLTRDAQPGAPPAVSGVQYSHSSRSLQGWLASGTAFLVGSLAGALLGMWGLHKSSETVAMAAGTGEAPRRAVLASGLAAGAAALLPPAPAIAAAPRTLGVVLQQQLAQRAARGALDIPLAAILRLVFHDAVTFDPETRTGGCNGSIRFPEELQRPENRDLAPVVATLFEVQEEMEKETGLAITFADVMAVTGSFVIARQFKADLCAKTDPGSCEVLYNGYGNKPPSIRLGRVDANTPEVLGRVPWEGSSVAEFREAAKRLGLSPKELCSVAAGLLPSEAQARAMLQSDPDLARTLAEVDSSKLTTTRTSYEVNTFKAFGKMVNVALFDDKQYN